MRLGVVEPGAMECLPAAHAWRTVAFDFASSTLTYRCSRCQATRTEVAGPTQAKEQKRRRRR